MKLRDILGGGGNLKRAVQSKHSENIHELIGRQG